MGGGRTTEAFKVKLNVIAVRGEYNGTSVGTPTLNKGFRHNYGVNTSGLGISSMPEILVFTTNG